jgi:hypothetical protein
MAIRSPFRYDQRQQQQGQRTAAYEEHDPEEQRFAKARPAG